MAALGVSSGGIAAVPAVCVAASFLARRPQGAVEQHLWTWMDVAGFRPEVAFYFDPLSLVMVVVVTFVAFWIHLYSAEFMAGDEGYSRFFAYMNLFVASMVVLVLADNLLLLYLGWEGVGVCGPDRRHSSSPVWAMRPWRSGCSCCSTAWALFAFRT